jgi:hypothetical protein
MKRAEWLLAALVVGLSMWLACRQPDLSWFNTHMARDYTRAQAWKAGHPDGWGGPELNYNGGRLFGPAFYVGLALLSGDIPTLLWQQHLLGLVPLLLLMLVVRRDLGRSAGWFFLLSFLLMPVHVSVSRTLWNPSWLLPLNCCVLLCARLVWARPAWAPLYFLLGWLGIQVHLSSLTAFLSGWALLCRRRPRLMLTGLGLLIGYMVLFKWLEGAAYVESVRGQYHWPGQSPWRYLSRWMFHLHLSARPLFDYELFPVIFRYGNALFPQAWAPLRLFQQLAPLWAALLLLAVVWPRRRPDGPIQSFYQSLLSLWLLSGLTAMYFYTAKQGVIPYRYGLMLYPAQFLLPALALSRPLPRWLRTVLLGAAALVFGGDACYAYQSLRVIAVSGRVSHVAADVYEIPLRDKMRLLGLSRQPYTYLHGPILNKVRLNEYSWFHDQRWEAIRSSLPVVADGQQHLAAVSLPLAEQGDHVPFRLEPVEVFALSYRLDGGAARQLPAGACFQPLENGPARSLSLEARVSAGGYVRLCYDDSPAFPTFRLRRLVLNGQDYDPRGSCPGWLAQRTVTLPVPSGGRLRLEFEVLAGSHRWSRIDCFKTREGGPFSPL